MSDRYEGPSATKTKGRRSHNDLHEQDDESLFDTSEQHNEESGKQGKHIKSYGDLGEWHTSRAKRFGIKDR